MIPLTRAITSGYAQSVTEKNVIGCASPKEFAANSRNRKVRGFFVGAPVKAALMGGLRPCWFSLREFPSLAHLSALPPNVQVGRQSLNGTLETNMSIQAPRASAQVFQFPNAVARATQYNPLNTALSSFSEAELVQAAMQYMERYIVGSEYSISGPGDVSRYLRTRIGTRDHEVFTVLFLDVHNHVLACEDLARGTTTKCHIHFKEVARRALQLNASKVIVSHNHPSGSSKPSSADRVLTNALADALDLIEIELLDHIVVSSTGAYSIKGDCNV